MRILHQVIYDIRHQPLVSWISIGATALAIFLIMVIYMVNGLGTVEAEPELQRSRLFYGTGMHLTGGSGEASSSLSREYAEEIYGNLEGVESVSYTSSWPDERDAQVGGGEAVEARIMATDAAFWDIYDFRFSDGRPFDAEDCGAGARRAVISSSLADRLFGKGAQAAGQEILLDLVPYTVTGVVSNVNLLMSQSYSDIFIPFSPTDGTANGIDGYPGCFGNTKVHLLASPGVTAESLRSQVSRRYDAIQAREMKDTGYKIIYHSQPYDAAVMSACNFGTNNTPDLEGDAMREWLSYLVLLLLPAINLSTMTRARMRRRVAEIGVRRAFGATRRSIVAQLLTENLLLTLAGGLAGLALSVVFALNFSAYVVMMVNSWTVTAEQITASPQFDMIFRWHTFPVALLFCVLLNLISAGVPAWRASRMNPAEALGGQGK
ncbi:MAG: ABC transporter permease [Muribaculaceae bacterium]|nr:ABC transporter permease [Muribaculaceae bacterium]